MTGKVPEDAFAYYVALGSERSYEAVARNYGVNKRTVVRCADREDWQTRLAEIERKARAAADAKLAEGMQEMSLRHRKLLLAMASRAATAIQTYPLKSGMEGIKAAELVIKLERLIAGEPTESRTISVEQVTRDEMSRFLIEDSEVEAWDDDAHEGEGIDGEEALET